MDWFQEFNAFVASLHPGLAMAAALVLLLAAALAADLIVKGQLINLVRRIARRTAQSWDDDLLASGVFSRLAHVVPALVIYYGIGLVPNVPAGLVTVIGNVALAYLALMLTLAAGAALSALLTIYERRPIARDRPIKGFVQVAKIAVYVLGALVIIAALMDRSPLLLLSGVGAMTAVLLLVFKDTILSLVASVQLTSLDMVRVGDWIEMPQYNADGDVVDVALHTVRVQNWDKTVTTIPTHKLISDSFRNWRAMSESGGRRIKRALHLDVSSIRFLTPAEVERFKGFALLADYIEGKEKELADYNAGLPGKRDAQVNLRRLTNVGTFRAYVFNYLKHHPKVHQHMTLLVRQLQPGPTGLPIEVYAFSNDTAWAVYEGVQADIFDHLLAIVPEFGLSVFQQPSGRDLRNLTLPQTASAQQSSS